ncbi:MAG: MmcQ/YjbR family DNA-binding protein [Alistipes sp.]|nr:MmcQ/YjbR family DNA-binding protein [Alistipes sp.]
MTREDVFRYARERYGTSPDYPWESTPDAAVLRKSNKKWYGLVMNVKKSRAGLEGDDCIDILNVKCSPFVREILIGEGKAVPAYHMNKRLWISVILDRVSEQELRGVLDESYDIVK